MHGIIDVSACYRIVVSVFQLLPHHIVVLDLLRMTPFLPDLIRAFRFVAGLVRLELAEHDIFTSPFQ